MCDAMENMFVLFNGNLLSFTCSIALAKMNALTSLLIGFGSCDLLISFQRIKISSLVFFPLKRSLKAFGSDDVIAPINQR